MPSEIQAALASWSLPVPVTVSLVLAAFVYARGWLHLNRAFPGVFPRWRLAAFMSGLFALWIAVGSPLEAFDDELLSIHMVQHILLMAVAPPLILLGAPALPLLHGLPKRFVRRALGPVLRWRPVQYLGRVLMHPAFCWLAATAALIGWHLPAAFEFALRSDSWHEVEHACFFTTSLLFWWPVVQPWPSVARWPQWSIPLYLFLGVLANDVLSAVLALWDRVLYPSYASPVPRLFNVSPLDDQAFAGALMWVFGTFVYLVPAVIITIQILSPSASSQRTVAREDLRVITQHSDLTAQI
jgi:cytochrome c oxidase assembly factor CtaG